MQGAFTSYRIERCERQAALGEEVVPDVNWMFTISLLVSGEERGGGVESASEETAANETAARSSFGSMRPLELSTRMICRSEGTASDSILDLATSGTILLMRETLERGDLKGRFVSVPMTRWEASRCVRAETTWVVLKAGFRGTWDRQMDVTQQQRTFGNNKNSTQLEKGVCDLQLCQFSTKGFTVGMSSSLSQIQCCFQATRQPDRPS